MATGNYKFTLQQNSQCASLDLHIYNTLIIPIIFSSINKMIQLVQFITYLYYTCKIAKDISNAGVSNGYQSIMHKTAILLGAMIGLNDFLYVIQSIVNLDNRLVALLQVALFLLQQSVAMIIFLFEKKVRRLCREHYLKD